MHCWVCDPGARALEDSARAAVVQYLTLISGNEKSSLQKRVPLTQPLHPHIKESMPFIEKMFEEMVLNDDEAFGQGLLKDESRYMKILRMLPDRDTKDSLMSRLSKEWRKDASASSKRRWDQLVKTAKSDIEGFRKKGMETEIKELQDVVHQIVVFHTYPRLDVNVSTHRNHLLKSPFVAHPKTGKICVPLLDVEHVQDFDPEGVPTLKSLKQDIDEYYAQNDSSKKAKRGDIGISGLAQYVEDFQTLFVDPLLADIHKDMKARVKNKESKDAAFTGEW